MTALTVLVAVGLVAAAPIAAPASPASQQQNKNTWRNLGIGSAAIGVNGLIHHNTTETVLGAAGAAYSANRYEQERRSQARSQRARGNRYRSGGSYVRNGKKYYSYGGHRFYLVLSTGERHRIA
jgi:hypothetical protein